MRDVKVFSMLCITDGRCDVSSLRTHMMHDDILEGKPQIGGYSLLTENNRLTYESYGEDNKFELEIHFWSAAGDNIKSNDSKPIKDFMHVMDYVHIASTVSKTFVIPRQCTMLDGFLSVPEAIYDVVSLCEKRVSSINMKMKDFYSKELIEQIENNPIDIKKLFDNPIHGHRALSKEDILNVKAQADEACARLQKVTGISQKPFDRAEFEECVAQSDTFCQVEDYIKTKHKEYVDNHDLSCICEMALAYLEMITPMKKG